MNRTTTALAGILVFIVLFFAVNILANAALRSVRIDLTEHGLYTLSEGSRNIASGIDEPITLTLYYSESLATGRPQLQGHGRRVRELLEEYVRRSAGAITLNIVDPIPFSEAEDEVARAGLAAAPLGANENFYFGLVGTNAIDGRETLPFFDPSQEQFLEYEISRLIYTLANPERPTLGVLSVLPLDGAPPNQMLQQPARPPWQITRELRSLFDVQVVTPGAPIPPEVDLLLVVHPKDLDEVMRYEIDQHVLGGGGAIICVDPHCEMDQHPMPQNAMEAMQWPRASDLTEVLAAWGVTMTPGSVVTDRKLAQRVRMNAPQGGRQETVPYVVWLGLKDDAIDAGDPITGRLGSINMAAVGELTHDTTAGTTFTPLLTTSDETGSVSVDAIRFMPDPKALLTDFTPTGRPAVVAARVSGVVNSAFDGPPDGAVSAGEHIATSAEPINVIVVADVDMLGDQFWVQRGMFGPTKIADNGDFLVNAVENLAGSSDLISIRAQGAFVRPFTRVEEIRRAAEEEYLGQEQELQDRLRETERKLNELPMATQENGQIILTPEQREELRRFQEERVETRRQLRAVRLNLDKDIEALGARLKIINIAALPLVVTLTAIVVGLVRMSRRRSGTARRTA